MVGVNRYGFYSSILVTGNAVRFDPIKSESAVYLIYAETGWYREWSIRPFIGDDSAIFLFQRAKTGRLAPEHFRSYVDCTPNFAGDAHNYEKRKELPCRSSF